jgi:hypothetical protein
LANTLGKNESIAGLNDEELFIHLRARLSRARTLNCRCWAQ